MTEFLSGRAARPPLLLSRRRLLQVGALAGGAGLVSALSGCAVPTGLPGPGTLTVALNRSQASLDNKLLQYDAVVTLQRGVRQALTRLTSDLRIENVLAERFELTGPTEWSVRLRPDIRYSDGSPVLVEDVTTALEMYRTTAGGFLATLFPEWPTVQRLDDRSFRLLTENPMPDLDYLMANILVTPAAANEPNDLTSGVGTGPFVIASANPGTSAYRLARNENYWAEPARTPAVRVTYLPEESSRIVALRSGEVDVIESISPDGVEQLRGLPGVAVDTTPGTRLTHLFYNFRKPADHPLADARVREALSFAIDGESLIEQILQGSVAQTEGVVPITLQGAASVGRFAFDPDRAKQALDSLGLRDLEVKIIWETGEFTADTQVMESVYEMLRAVGVRPTLQQFEPGGDISTWRQGRAGDWDVVANGYPGSTGLAITMLQGVFGGTAAKEENRDTYHGYVFPEIADALAQASYEVDAERRKQLLLDVQKSIWATWPAMWAFSPNAVVARRDRVQGIELGANNSYDLARVGLRADA